MPSLIEILKDPNYINANPATKEAIFNKYAPQDENYTGANEATQQAIRQRFGLGGAEFKPLATPPAAPKEEVAEVPIVSPEELLTPPSAKPVTPAAPTKAKEPRPEPPPYKSRGEALDDAVNLLEEGYGMDKVTSAFSNLGISRDEIVAHGQKRKSEYFAPQKIKDVGVGAKPGEPVPPPSEMRGTDTTLYQDITGVGKRAAARGRQAIAGLLKETGVYDEDELAFCRIVDFPMFEK